MAFESMRRSIITKFLVSVAMAIPLAAAVGILYSFKFCGPIHRFHLYFQSLSDGRWDVPCSLRKGDDLNDVCESINQAVEAFNSTLTDNDKVLRSLQALHHEGALNSSDDEKLQELLTEADRVLGRNQERLPSLSPNAEMAPSAEGASSEPVVQPTA